TGQIQQSGHVNPEELFRESLCDFAEILNPCNEIRFQVRELDDFGEAEDMPAVELNAEGELVNQEFSPGGVNDVVMIRAVYRYSIITPLMQPVLTNRGDGTRLMMSTLVL